MSHRPIASIAADIIQDWNGIGNGVNYAAKPYLDAMLALININDNYGYDSARSIVAYGLSNMGTYRGENAKRFKAELKAMLK
jgi:hypothetical protein